MNNFLTGCRQEVSHDQEAHLKLLVYTMEAASRQADRAGSYFEVDLSMAQPWLTFCLAWTPQTLIQVYTTLNLSASRSCFLPAGSGKMTWLVDFHAAHLHVDLPLKVRMATVKLLQRFYPERLGLLIGYHPPKHFALLFKVQTLNLTHAILHAVTALSACFEYHSWVSSRLC